MINNHNDYERIKFFAKILTEKQLLEMQGIMIEAESNQKYLSDVVSAFDNALKEKHNENKINFKQIINKYNESWKAYQTKEEIKQNINDLEIELETSRNQHKPTTNIKILIDNLKEEYKNSNDEDAKNWINKINNIIYSKEDKIFTYKGSEYNIPDELSNIIYQDKKLEYQLDYLNELKETKELSYLKTLTKDELIQVAQRSKDFEEEWAINDNIPDEAIRETIERHKIIKRDELYDKYRSYTNNASELSRTALELEAKKDVDAQINYLKNKIANYEREPKMPIETPKLKL